MVFYYWNYKCKGKNKMTVVAELMRNRKSRTEKYIFQSDFLGRFIGDIRNLNINQSSIPVCSGKCKRGNYID